MEHNRKVVTHGWCDSQSCINLCCKTENKNSLIINYLQQSQLRQNISIVARQETNISCFLAWDFELCLRKLSDQFSRFFRQFWYQKALQSYCCHLKWPQRSREHTAEKKVTKCYRMSTVQFLTTKFDDVGSRLFGETLVRQTSRELQDPTSIVGAISSMVTDLL